MEKAKIEMIGKAKDSLLPDETVLWGGSAEQFPLMEAARRQSLILRWILCAAVFAGTLAAYLALSAKVENFSIGVVIALVAVFGYIALVPSIDRGRLLKKTRFYVTDRRVMTAIGINEAPSLSRVGLKVKAIPAGDNCVHLLFGAATALPEKKLMLKAIAPSRADGSNEVNGLVFYNVKKVPELQEFF